MRKIIVFILSFIFIQSNLLFNDVVNSIVGIVGSMPITYEDFLSRKTFLTLQARSVGQRVTDDMVYKDLVEERVMYLKLKENNYVIEENDVKRRLESIAKQYNMNADQFAKQLMAEGISYDEYKNSIKKQIAMENLYGLVVNNTEISDKEADEFYNSTKDKSAFEADTLVKLSWIFFKAATFTEKGDGYILIGPGRWGSSDPSLGIPVKWPHISSARLITEASLPNYRIEPSQGTHFFQNLTSFGVGYFTIDTRDNDSVYDIAYLDNCPAAYESEFIRIVHFDNPLTISINGRSGLGIVVKPKY